MKIIVEENALNWFKEEMDIKNGEAVRFFIRYGGCSAVQQGFSLGLAKEEHTQGSVSVVLDGMTFFVDQEDIWYFKEHDLQVFVNDVTGELDFSYPKH